MDKMAACKLPDCDKPLKRNGFCYSHYMKNWRYGTPTPQFEPKWVDVTGQRFGTLVVRARQGDKWFCVCDCGKSRVTGLSQLNQQGEANTCGDRTAHRRTDSGYRAAHERCRTDRGLVQKYACVNCGGPAQHWSYNHDEPNELLGTVGVGRGKQVVLAYSLDPNRYSPRCAPCHKRFDLDHIGGMDAVRLNHGSEPS